MAIDHAALAEHVKKAQMGDQDAFAEIYQALAKNVYYGALRMVKDHHDAMTVAQDVMVELYQNLDKLGKPQALVAFVNRMVHFRSIDYLRKERKLQGVPLEELGDSLSLEENPEKGPQAQVERSERAETVLAAVEQLPEYYRSVILLYYYNEYSVQEISDILDRDIGTVKSQLHRGRSALKKQLQGIAI